MLRDEEKMLGDAESFEDKWIDWLASLKSAAPEAAEDIERIM